MKEKKPLSCSSQLYAQAHIMYYTEKRIDIRARSGEHAGERVRSLLLDASWASDKSASRRISSSSHGARWRFIKLAQLQRAEAENQLIIFTPRLKSLWFPKPSKHTDGVLPFHFPRVRAALMLSLYSVCARDLYILSLWSPTFFN